MRCSLARERITLVAHGQDLPGDPELASHLGSCPGCAEVLRQHVLLLAELDSPTPLPDFGDLGPRVISRLHGPQSLGSSRWRSAAVAALAVTALALGYLFGQASAGGQPSADSMAATYQAAFTGQSANSTERACLETGSGTEGAMPMRNSQ